MKTSGLMAGLVIMLLIFSGTSGSIPTDQDYRISELGITLVERNGVIHIAWESSGEVYYSNTAMCPNPTPIIRLAENGNGQALLRLLETPNAKKVQISHTATHSYNPFLEISEDGLIHLGWVEELGDGSHIYYGRSTNDGLTFWAIDATEYAAPYLQYCGIDETDPAVIVEITRTLEEVYVLDGSHFLYVPLNPPMDFAYPLPPDAILWGTVNDPYFDQYQAYEYLMIDDMYFYKPMCNDVGIPNKPPRAPDLEIEDIIVSDKPISTDSTTVYFNVRNVGTASMSGEIKLISYDNYNKISELSVPPLEKQEERVLEQITSFSTTEAHRIIGYIDAEEAISEGDESNNLCSTDLSIPTNIDLSCVSIDITPESLKEATKIPVSVLIKKVGNVATPSFNVHVYEDEISGENLITGFRVPASSIPQTFEKSFNWHAVFPNEHRLLVQIDVENTVAEFDEDNNIFSHIYYIQENAEARSLSGTVTNNNWKVSYIVESGLEITSASFKTNLYVKVGNDFTYRGTTWLHVLENAKVPWISMDSFPTEIGPDILDVLKPVYYDPDYFEIAADFHVPTSGTEPYRNAVFSYKWRFDYGGVIQYNIAPQIGSTPGVYEPCIEIPLRLPMQLCAIFNEVTFTSIDYTAFYNEQNPNVNAWQPIREENPVWMEPPYDVIDVMWPVKIEQYDGYIRTGIFGGPGDDWWGTDPDYEHYYVVVYREEEDETDPAILHNGHESLDGENPCIWHENGKEMSNQGESMLNFNGFLRIGEAIAATM